MSKDTEEKRPSKISQRAKSFRDDLKSMIKRTSSTSLSGHASPHKSPKPRRKVSRGMSFNEGTKTERPAKMNDLDKLERESKKVFHSLHFLTNVVNKNTPQFLPESATDVLETIMQVNQLLGNFFTDQQSTIMLSLHNQVFQSLANLIRWADDVLMADDQTLERGRGSEVIKALSVGVEELLKLSIEKLKHRQCGALPSCVTVQYPSRPTSISFAENNHRNSLPDIPLTPREKEILEETREMTMSRSSDNILGDDISLPSGTPPPKPPRPSQLQSHVSGDIPPPLPVKKKTRLSGSMSDTSGSSTPTNTCSPREASHSQIHCDSSRVSHPVRLSQYDNLSDLLVLNADCHHGHFQKYNRKLAEMTADILQSKDSSSLTSSQENAPRESIPPLPEKHHGQTCMITLDNSIQAKATSTSMYDHPGLQHPPLGDEHGFMLSFKQLTHTGTVIDNSRGHIDQVQRSSIESSSSSKVLEGITVYSKSRTSVSHRVSSKSAVSHSILRGQRKYPKSCSDMPSVLWCPSSKVTSSQETFSSLETFSSSSMESIQQPPPLPPKRKIVDAYLKILGPVQSTPVELSRHSVHSVHYYQDQWLQHQREIFQPLYPRSNTISTMSILSSPARSDVFSFISDCSLAENAAMLSQSPPTLPPKKKTSSASSNDSCGSDGYTHPDDQAGKSQEIECGKHSSVFISVELPADDKFSSTEVQKDNDSDFVELKTLDDVDVTDQLIMVEKPDECEIEIRGGSVDALIVHATAAGKNAKNVPHLLYQEAFLTTYRTFITPLELIEKLRYRYEHFSRVEDIQKKKLSRYTFSLLIRVVDDLCNEISKEVLELLMDFVFQLLCDGELMLARIMRKKVLEKCEVRKRYLEAAQHVTLLSSYQVSSKPLALTDFKSEQVAEQMTLLDAELFHKIEIPEVLLWSRQQLDDHGEDPSPNLTQFTEHFNNMSYWCRTKILEQEDSKDRERYMLKFIKVMKHLRKLSNFNSFLAILSALEASPIRRLEWPKQNLETLCEFSVLIDSTSSFRAYRQALAETEPPCIPYLGLVLQDLTFVHVGNKDFLEDGSVNFAKRWQQFNILDNIRRFKQCNFDVRKNPKILSLFNNFCDYMSEESLWQISESIKPRGGRKKGDQTQH